MIVSDGVADLDWVDPGMAINPVVGGQQALTACLSTHNLQTNILFKYSTFIFYFALGPHVEKVRRRMERRRKVMKVRSRRRIYIGWVRGASRYLQVI